MREKIYLKIEESSYKYSVYGFSFYFSSKFYFNKFVENVEKYVDNETIKNENKYGTNILMFKYLLISLYKKIEKRGFKVYDEVEEKYLTENVVFKTEILTY